MFKSLANFGVHVSMTIQPQHTAPILFQHFPIHEVIDKCPIPTFPHYLSVPIGPLFILSKYPSFSVAISPFTISFSLTHPSFAINANHRRFMDNKKALEEMKVLQSCRHPVRSQRRKNLVHFANMETIAEIRRTRTKGLLMSFSDKEKRRVFTNGRHVGGH